MGSFETHLLGVLSTCSTAGAAASLLTGLGSRTEVVFDFTETVGSIATGVTVFSGSLLVAGEGLGTTFLWTSGWSLVLSAATVSAGSETSSRGRDLRGGILTVAAFGAGVRETDAAGLASTFETLTSSLVSGSTIARMVFFLRGGTCTRDCG